METELNPYSDVPHLVQSLQSMNITLSQHFLSWFNVCKCVELTEFEKSIVSFVFALPILLRIAKAVRMTNEELSS